MAEEYLLPFAVEGILAKLTSLAAQEISLESGFKAELSRLRRSLSTIRGFLGDVACQPPGRGKALENWVKKLKNIAGDADDVLDDLHYEVVRRKVEKENHTKNKVLKFFSVSNPIVFRLRMERKIRKINASLVVLKTKASIIGLVSDKRDATPCGIGWERQTNSLIATDERLFGRKEDLSNIITTLTNSNITQGNIGVLAVVGMPGIGKTTLAKSVYLADPIDRCFDRKIWVSVSHPFDINSILSRFLELLNSTQAEGIQRQNALLKKLREELKEIRYLLLLDDIWDEDSEKWSNFMNYLSKVTSSRGSAIIVTTCSAKVASVMETLPRCNLGIVSADDCWSVLKHRAVSDNNAPLSQEFERIGRQIAEQCAGVPLVAKVLGSMLSSKCRVDEWLSIKECRIWDLPEGEDRMISLLKLEF